ncbi:hypothetical protein Ancab_006385, partial [Ancistrocladus abbreviatus]
MENAWRMEKKLNGIWIGVSSEGHGTGSNGNKQRSYAEVVNSTAQTRDSKKETWTQIKKPSLTVTTKRKDQDWLRGCLDREIKSITMLEGLEAEMENEGIRVYRLRPMGGNQVLMSTMGASSVVESVERDRQLLERWFKIIRPWKETD